MYAGPRETDRSAADPNLLEMATQEGRTLITFDSDFGELVYKSGVPAPYGVLFFRLHDDVPRSVKAAFITCTTIAWDTWPHGVWTIQIRHPTASP